jgi:hypothetical protein
VDLTARYQLNGDDGLACLLVHHPSFKMHGVVSAVSSLLIILLGALWLYLPGGGQPGAWVSIGLGVAILAIGTGHRAYLINRLRRTWDQMEPTELTAREGGLVVVERSVQSEVAWSRFVRVREGPDHFLLYRSADLYGIVPKRGFATAADLESFRNLATDRIEHASRAVEQRDATDKGRNG